MAITIKHVEPKRNRRKGYERKVKELAPLFQQLQAEGFISAGQIGRILPAHGILTAKGLPYAESVIFGMLRRGKKLGLPLILRSRSEAAGAWGRGPRPPKNKKPCPIVSQRVV